MVFHLKAAHLPQLHKIVNTGLVLNSHPNLAFPTIPKTSEAQPPLAAGKESVLHPLGQSKQKVFSISLTTSLYPAPHLQVLPSQLPRHIKADRHPILAPRIPSGSRRCLAGSGGPSPTS